MAIKTGNAGPTAGHTNFSTGPATLLAVHWSSATDGDGTLDFRDSATASATGSTSRLILDTPSVGANSAVAGDFLIPGGGLHFNTALSVQKANTGGVTVVYATGILG